jgi:hypothetical protein
MIITRVYKACQPIYSGVKNKVTSLVTLRLLPFFKLWNGHTALAVAGIIGPITLTVGDLSAGLASPGYSIIQNSISSLALTNIGWLQTIGFLALGLLVEIFTAGLLFNMKGAKRFYLGIALFVIFGFALLLIGAFRTDPVGVQRTIEGRIHGFTASTAFLLFPIAILLLMPSIKRDPNWKYLYRYSFVTFILAVVLIVAVRVVPETNFMYGLVERLLVANMIIWVEVAAINLFILSLKRKAKAGSG